MITVVLTVEGGGNGVPGGVVGPDEVMMGYNATGASGAMGPSAGADVLGSTGDYSPQGTPNSLGGHNAGTVEAAGPYTTSVTGPTTYSPQDSPASSAGGGNSNGQLPSFGFTQEQVACVCEVSKIKSVRPSRDAPKKIVDSGGR